MPPATPDLLEARLRDLPAHGTRLPDPHADPSDAGQLWAFKVDGVPYRLHFHPAAGRGAAMRRFLALQSMQKAGVSAPRAIAVLKGFRLAGATGDAVITTATSAGAASRLSDFLVDQALPDATARRSTVAAVVEAIRKLSRAGLTHRRLTLDAFAVAGSAGAPAVSLADVMAVRAGRLRDRDLLSLDDDAARFATRTERLRAWRALTGTNRPPARRPDQFGALGALLTPPPPRDVAARLTVGDWSGLAVCRPVFPQAHSSVGRLVVSPDDWRAAWADLVGRLDAGDLDAIKRDASGEVVATELSVGGRTLAVVAKRPRRKRPLTHAIDAMRPTRARRSFVKTWALLRRGLPVERPLLLMERRRLGYVVDAVAVFEGVPGVTLASADLRAIPPDARETLFRRCGRLLRRIERLGLSHFDAKMTNWIVFDDPRAGPTPVMLDCDGVRPYRWPTVGPRRLARAIDAHPQGTAEDVAAAWAGYEGR